MNEKMKGVERKNTLLLINQLPFVDKKIDKYICEF